MTGTKAIDIDQLPILVKAQPLSLQDSLVNSDNLSNLPIRACFSILSLSKRTEH